MGINLKKLIFVTTNGAIVILDKNKGVVDKRHILWITFFFVP